MIKDLNDSNRQRGFAIALAIAIGAMLVTGAGYFLYSWSSTDKKTEDQVLADMAKAQARLAKESAKLEDLRTGFRTSFPLASLIQNSYSQVQQIVKNTDLLFNNPNSQKPELKVKTKASLEADINARRLQIAEMLDDWKLKTSTLSASSVTSDTVASVEQDAQKIKDYIDELAQIVAGLTPSNSGLSQELIDTYEEIVTEATQEIDSVLENLSTPDTQTTPQTQTQTVTPEDVANQESVVQQAQDDVDNLQNQIDQQNQNNPSPSPSPAPTPIPPYTTGNPYDNSLDFPDTPINATSGLPRLIQGENKE